MEQSVELMTAVCFLIIGLSMLLRTDDWLSWVKHLQVQGHNTSLVLGSVNLLLGSFIVAFHWVWEGIALIVTVFGVLFLFRSVVLLSCPGFLPNMLQKLMPHFNGWVKASGLIVAILAAALFYDLYA